MKYPATIATEYPRYPSGVVERDFGRVPEQRLRITTVMCDAEAGLLSAGIRSAKWVIFERER
jgi:hypothetical protein